MAARVTVGEKLCRNEDWLKIIIQYATNAVIASQKLRLFPVTLRYIVHWFVPECRTLRAQITEARALLRGIISEREKENHVAAAKGQPFPFYDDLLEWGEEEARKGNYSSQYKNFDPADFQLISSAVGLHSTSGLLSKTLTNILLRPELIPSLREEIIEAVRDQGLTKPFLHKLHLLDSIMKETQRLHPLELSKYSIFTSLYSSLLIYLP